MQDPELIAMLTWHDVTVENAKEIFLEAKDAPANCWGFKYDSISYEKMCDLASTMKEAGKKTFLEVIAIEEKCCLKAIKDAVRSQVIDHVLGTVYYDSVAEIATEAGLRYSPFVGLDSDTRLRGSISKIVSEAKEVARKEVFGINISGFRYVDGDPMELINALLNNLNKPLSVTGGIDSYEKLDYLKKNNIWAFTIGGAFFEKKFGETFAEQIQAVTEYMKH